MERRFNRRQFCELAIKVPPSFALGRVVGRIDDLSRFFSPERLNLAGLEPNRDISLTNLSIIPQTLYSHSGREILSFPVNFANMYDRKTHDHVNHNPDPKKGGNLWGYGEGLKEAIKRKQKVFLVLEFPGMTDTDINLEEWEKYVAAVALEYPSPYFILGNEINTQDQGHFRDNPLLFAKYHAIAALKIRQVLPDTKILMYGEAYNENGETLKRILEAIGQHSASLNILPNSLIDGLTFHYYDRARFLPERTSLYRKIAREYGLPSDLYLTELGKPEKEKLDADQHQNIVAQNVSIACSLVSKGLVDCALWHTAYANIDPHRHSLSSYDREGRLLKKPAFDTFWMISKLLYSDISSEYPADGITLVRGKTSEDDIVEVIWNNTPFSEKKPKDPYYFGIKLPTTNSPFLEGKPVIRVKPKKEKTYARMF